MDNLSAVLAEHQARGAFALHCEMDSPWSMQVADRATVGMVVMLRGSCVLQAEGREPASVTAGDVAIIKGPKPYVLSDEPGAPFSVVVEPGQVCRGVPGREAAIPMTFGPRSWGNSRDGECAFLAVAYELPGQIRGRLLPAIPEFVVVRAGDSGAAADSAAPSGLADAGLVQMLTAEMATAQPGQDAMVDRFVDLVLISTLRRWFSSPDADPPRWWSAQDDPMIGEVLSLMHHHPEQPWSLESLADRVGYSRATVSRRFCESVGQPPMSYLADWRLALAADLLRGTDRSVEAIAHSVGYRNAFAFSSAFKRQHGVSPRAFRLADAA
ncbi:AraC-like DNA-binding protein [Nakamurella sp. UYEF19]|uniref:AraC family transcriptional regulator n=1 Tax=Nakamurella sp. UYEF19 TaxID=1756392 RepID=UPI003396D5DD